jgi:hypothetical protein
VFYPQKTPIKVIEGLKKKYLAVCLLLLIGAIGSFLNWNSTLGTAQPSPTLQSGLSLDVPSERMFVMSEAPLKTLGMLSAFTASLAVYKVASDKLHL